MIENLKENAIFIEALRKIRSTMPQLSLEEAIELSKLEVQRKKNLNNVG